MDWPPLQCVICGHEEKLPYMEVRDHSISRETFHLKTCAKCGFISTADAPDQGAIGRYYESDDYISHSDTRKNLTSRLYHLARKRMLATKRGWVNKFAGQNGRLLDIGSGTGYFLNEMQQHGWNAEGIEVNKNAREASIRNFSLHVSPPNAVDDLENGSFDVITLWHVLEHVHNLNEYWKMFSRLLAPDGVLFIAVPNITSYDARHYGDSWAALDVPRHLWHFRPEDIQRLADKHGFEMESMIGMPLDGYYVSILSERYKHSTMGLVKGFWRGLLSQIKASDDHKMSSVVYVLKPAGSTSKE